MGGSKGSKALPERDEGEKKAKWTLNVYMAGDNNLTEEMNWGLQEIKKTCGRLDPGGKDGVNVVAQFDPRSSQGRKYCFAPPRPGGIDSEQAEADGNLEAFEELIYTDAFIEAAAPGVSNPAARQLAAFLADQIKNLLPADQYFVVLSGHGSGATGDFLTDLDPGTSLSIPELGRILALGRDLYWEKYRELERDGTRKRIGILGMDSCLMSTAEVCYEVRDQAHFLVASEGWVSNTGWPYHRVLEALIDPETKKPEEAPPVAEAAGGDPARDVARHVAERVAERYAEFYRDYELSDVSTDVAVCDLAAFRAVGSKEPSLVQGLRSLAAACIPRLEGLYAWGLVAEADEEKLRHRLVPDLAEKIARDLGDLGLKKKLMGGSSDAVTYLSSPELGRRPLTPARARALLGLLDSLDGTYHVGGQSLKARLAARGPDLVRQLEARKGSPGARGAKAPSAATALAVARTLREFDPAMEEALRRVVEKETKGEPAGRRARLRLRKLHQALLRLDLHERLDASQGPDPEAIRLRDGLMAARWEAQSFKGDLYVDLFDFCGCLGHRDVPVKEVIRSTADIAKAAEDVVVRSHYTGPEFQHAHGLSIYLPVDARDYMTSYDHLALAQATGWGRLTRAYLQSTRRARRDEKDHWARADDRVIRTGYWEADPLAIDTIEGRIADVVEPSAFDEMLPENVRTGTERKIRTGTERKIRTGTERKIRTGTERRIRTGTERRIRTGTERKIKGEDVLAVLGNPPDGFYRQQGGAD